MINAQSYNGHCVEIRHHVLDGVSYGVAGENVSKHESFSFCADRNVVEL